MMSRLCWMEGFSSLSPSLPASSQHPATTRPNDATWIVVQRSSRRASCWKAATRRTLPVLATSSPSAAYGAERRPHR